MISAEKMKEFLTDPDFGWEVVEPEGKDIWDIIVEWIIYEDKVNEESKGSIEMP